MKEFIDKLIERLEADQPLYVSKAIKIVNELAEEYKLFGNSEQVKGGWIACSERLPEKAGKYLVTINCGGDVHTTVRRFNPKPKHPKQNEPLFTNHIPLYSGWERRTCGVIAWKDLPAPYTEGE